MPALIIKKKRRSTLTYVENHQNKNVCHNSGRVKRKRKIWANPPLLAHETTLIEVENCKKKHIRRDRNGGGGTSSSGTSKGQKRRGRLAKALFPRFGKSESEIRRDMQNFLCRQTKSQIALKRRRALRIFCTFRRLVETPAFPLFMAGKFCRSHLKFICTFRVWRSLREFKAPKTTFRDGFMKNFSSSKLIRRFEIKTGGGARAPR